MASGVTPRLPPCPPPAPHTASHAPVDDHAAAAKREGDAAFGRGDFAAAASAYASALNHLAPLGHDPHLRGTLLANRCLTLLRLGGQTAAALADAREACRMRPRWAKAHVRLAQAHEDGGDFAAAAVSYKRAVELEAALEPTLVKAVAALERRAARQHCLVTMQGHQGAIYDAAVHPQPLELGSVATQLVATCGADATVRVWCSRTGRQLQLLAGHSDRVTCLRWSACGGLLASAALDCTTCIWRLAPGGCRTPDSLLEAGPVLALGDSQGRVTCLDFCPGGSLLATGASCGQVRVWSLAADAQHQELSRHGGTVSSVCFSPCGRLLASASGDSVCRVWSATSGESTWECVADIAWESGPVNACSFVQCGGPSDPALLLTCHVQQLRREGRVMLWDVLTRRPGCWVDGKLVGPVAAIDDFRGKITSTHCRWTPAPGGGGGGELVALLAAACSDGSVRVVDIAAVAVAPADNKAAVAAAAAPLLELRLADAAPVSGGGDVSWHLSAVQQAAHDRNQVAVSPDGGLLAAVGPDCRVLVLDLDGGGRGQQALGLAAHSGAVRVLRWLSGGRLLSAGEDGVARVWQATHVPA